MSTYEKFNFPTLQSLEEKAAELHVSIPFDSDVSVLQHPVQIGNFCSPNALVAHPLECRDGSLTGTPQELTFRRYRRTAEGGSGIIWLEATSVCDAGKSVTNQLEIREDNLPVFEKLITEIKSSARKMNGEENEPLCAIELTHSGRYAGKRPVIACHNKYLDQKSGLNSDYPLISDSELDRVKDAFIEKTLLSIKAGFELIDIKCCHGYLIGELLSARTREGKYGGCFENRIRLLLEIVDALTEAAAGKAEITMRISAYDMIPNGWGMKDDGSMELDDTESIRLAHELFAHGVKIINLSAGNPYISPSIGRPFDRTMKGDPEPEEHPLISIARIFDSSASLQQAVPEIKFVGTGYSWLRQYLGYAAAANITQKRISLVGVGREALAYPDYANDLLHQGALDPAKVCQTCSLCSQLMRCGGPAGCLVHDSAVYKPFFMEKCR